MHADSELNMSSGQFQARLKKETSWAREFFGTFLIYNNKSGD